MHGLSEGGEGNEKIRGRGVERRGYKGNEEETRERCMGYQRVERETRRQEGEAKGQKEGEKEREKGGEVCMHTTEKGGREMGGPGVHAHYGKGQETGGGGHRTGSRMRFRNVPAH